jgi:hypothetical protein
MSMEWIHLTVLLAVNKLLSSVLYTKHRLTTEVEYVQLQVIRMQLLHAAYPIDSFQSSSSSLSS